MSLKLQIGCTDKTCFLMPGHVYNRCFKINIIHVVMFQVAVFLQKIPIQKCSLRLRQGYIFCVCNCRSLSIIYIILQHLLRRDGEMFKVFKEDYKIPIAFLMGGGYQVSSYTRIKFFNFKEM